MKHKKIIAPYVSVLLTFMAVFFACICAPASAVETEVSWQQGEGEGEAAAFREIWGYLMSGEERFLDPSFPVTDIGYFGAGLDVKGKLIGVPKRERIAGFSGRVHLVVAEVSNRSLTHFALDPALPVRRALIDDIVSASEPFDGVQIDFELVLPEDKENFFTFLAEIKERIGQKTFSVAIPARTKVLDDAYNYKKIAALADRVIVMAYDEHWSGSAPGSIASLEWCKRVSSFAIAEIGKPKLVMGLPFYGRAWGEKNPSKAYKYSALSTLIEEKGIGDIGRADEIPFFEYLETVKVRVFFEDARSVLSRAKLYQKASVRNIAFWRIGQEDPAIWGVLNASP